MEESAVLSPLSKLQNFLGDKGGGGFRLGLFPFLKALTILPFLEASSQVDVNKRK